MGKFRRLKKSVALLLAVILVFITSDISTVITYAVGRPNSSMQNSDTSETVTEEVSTEPETDESSTSLEKPVPSYPTGYLDSGFRVTQYPGSEINCYDNTYIPLNKASILPSSYSSVDKGYVTSVKSQTSNTCWAYAICAAMESSVLAHGYADSPEDVDFSEYALTLLSFRNSYYQEQTGDYVDYDMTIDEMFDNGGHDIMAFAVLSKGIGIYNENNISYKDFKNSDFDTIFSEDDIDYILTGQKYLNGSDESAIKKAIMEHGAVTASYNMDYFVDFYEQSHVYTYDNSTLSNHANVIVGWDDNYDKTNFTVTKNGVTYEPQNNGAWLLKNSWSTNSGLDGYVWISYEDSVLTYSDMTYYELTPKSEYNDIKIYQHDGATAFQDYISTKKAIAVYTITDDTTQILEEITFATFSSHCNYTISIYKNTVDTPLEDGQLMSVTSGSTTAPGYWTVQLSKKTQFNPGDIFSIVIEFDNYARIIYGRNIYSYVSTIKPGQNYYNKNNVLYDAYELGSNNLCIKAFMSEVSDSYDAPKIISTSMNGTEQLDISWQDMDGALSYELWKSTTPTGEDAKVITGITNPYYTDIHQNSANAVDTITMGKTYYYKVRAIYADGTSEYSNIKAVEIEPIAPALTGKLVDNKEVQLSWNPIADVTGYKVYKHADGGLYECIATLSQSDTSCTDDDIRYNTDYTYYVVSYISVDGNDYYSPHSNAFTCEKYMAVPKISYTHINNDVYGQVRFFWSYTNGSSAYFNIYRDNQLIDTVSGGTSLYIDNIPSCTPGSTYCYKVQGFVETDEGILYGNVVEDTVTIINQPLDADLRWYVTNQDNKPTVALKLYDAQDTDYKVAFNTDANLYSFQDKVISGADLSVGYPISATNCPVGTPTAIGIKKNGAATSYQNPHITVGHAFELPVLETIKNCVATTTSGVTLSAVITNPMPYFDYRYQWYISDTKDGEGTAIDGATDSEYTVSVNEDDVKFYYCQVICEYGDIYTVNSTNSEGFHTMVMECDDIESIKNFWVDNYYSGMHYLQWDESANTEVTGYNIYISEDNINYTKLTTVNRESTLYAHDVSDHAEYTTLYYKITPYILKNDMVIDGPVSSVSEIVLQKYIDVELRWFVRKNSSGVNANYFRLIGDLPVKYYEALKGFEGTNYVFYEDYISFDKQSALEGKDLSTIDFPVGEISYLTFCDESYDYAYQPNAYQLGGEFMVPVPAPIPDALVTISDDDMYLETTITNPMVNFDYRYQWYVSDTKDGEGFAIDGATSDRYKLTYTENTTKYYYCVITCEYGDITTVTTSNNSGERTQVTYSDEDIKAPTITGITNGCTYYGDATFTVTDAMSDIINVTIDGIIATSVNATYTILADNKAHTIVATDDAGNSTTYTISVYKIYTVTFKTDGSTVATRYVQYGHTLTDIPEIPAKVGYNQVAPTWDVTDFSNITSDLVVNAVYTANVYTITFKTDDSTVATKYVQYGHTLTDIPEIPAKTGYNQVAPTWDVADFSNITADLIVNAVYTINEYTITLNNGDGYSFDINSITVKHGESASFIITIADGYEVLDIFKVYANSTSIRANKYGDNYKCTITNITEDITVTVEGVSDTTKLAIIGVVDGGVYYGCVDITIIGATSITIEDTTIPTNGSSSSISYTGDNKEHTIVATDAFGNSITCTFRVYKIYTVTFVVEGNTIATESVKYGHTLTDIPEIPAKTGYNQVAPTWDVADFSNITSDLVVNAVYTINEYTITLNNNDGYTFDVNSITVKHGESASFVITIADGYSVSDAFAVYANSAVLNVTESEGNYVCTIDNITEDITVTVGGVADVTPPVITGIVNGGVYYDNTSFTVTDAVTVTIDGEVVSSANGTYTISADNQEHTVVATDASGNSTTYTIGVYKVYTVTFKVEDCTIATRTVKYGHTLTDIPEIPAKTGYNQVAPTWDVTDFSNITSDLVVNAVYTINEYTITLNNNDGYTFDVNSITVKHGESASFVITIADGYSVSDAFAVYANSAVLNVTESEGNYVCTIDNITEDINITVDGVADVTPPVITGIVNGGVYYDNTSFTVTDAVTVTIDSEVVSSANGTYTISADNQEHTVVATDDAGNSTTYTIGVYKVYTVTFKVEGNTIATESVKHGHTLMDIPEIPAKTGYNQVAPTWDVTDFSNITSDLVVNAVYTINEYTITLNNNDGYTFNVNNLTVKHGESASFVITIADGYGVSDAFAVYANSAVLNVTESEGNYVCTIDNITEDITVIVDGVADVTPPVITGIVNGGVYYTTQVFNIEDANLINVTINNKVTTSYSLGGNCDAIYTIIAIDKAYNTSIYTVTMKSIDSIADDINSITVDNVKSSDTEAITNIETFVNNVDITTATDSEKVALQAISDRCVALKKRIIEAAVYMRTDNIVNASSITADNVILDNCDILMNAKTDYETALTYINNYTQEELSAINAELSRINDALQVINQVKNAMSLIDILPDPNNVETGDTKAEKGLAVAKATYTALCDYAKSLVPKAYTLKLDALTAKLTKPVVTHGDSNNDGIVDVKDAVAIKKFIAGVNIDLNDSACDVNNDGIIDIKDAVKLLKYLAGNSDIILGETI